MCLDNIFESMASLFIYLNAFWRAEVINFNLPVLYGVCFFDVSYLRNNCLIQGHKSFLMYFLIKVLWVFYDPLQAEFWFQFEVRVDIHFFLFLFLHMIDQVFWLCLLKRLFFLYWNTLATCWKMKINICTCAKRNNKIWRVPLPD